MCDMAGVTCHLLSVCHDMKGFCECHGMKCKGHCRIAMRMKV